MRVPDFPAAETQNEHWEDSVGFMLAAIFAIL